MEPSKSKLLLKRYFCNNSAVCGYSEETNAPNSSLKTCVRCELVKYCSKDCEIQKRPEHHVVCKERRNHLRRLTELKKDLNVVYNLRFRQNQEHRAASGSEYIAMLKKLEKETYDMAEEKLDYHLFEKAYDFSRLSIEYCKPDEGSEMVKTIAKTLGYQLTLDYEVNGVLRLRTLGVEIFGPHFMMAKLSFEICRLVFTIKEMNIPELCDYMNSYATFVSVLRSSSRDSVYYRVYCNDIPLRKIKQYLEMQVENDYEAFVDKNVEYQKTILTDHYLGGHSMTVLEDLLFNSVIRPWRWDREMGYAAAAKAFSAFIQKHPQIHQYLRKLLFDWRENEEDNEADEEEDLEGEDDLEAEEDLEEEEIEEEGVEEGESEEENEAEREED